MNELEKAAEKREIEICQYSTKDCLNTNDCHRCQWGVPSLDLRCSNNASFKLGAQWQAKQSPWISVEERLPEEYKEVLVRYKVCAETKYDVLFIYGSTSWCFADMEEYIDESMTVTHWMPIPELPKE